PEEEVGGKRQLYRDGAWGWLSLLRNGLRNCDSPGRAAGGFSQVLAFPLGDSPRRWYAEARSIGRVMDGFSSGGRVSLWCNPSATFMRWSATFSRLSTTSTKVRADSKGTSPLEIRWLCSTRDSIWRRLIS